MIDSIQFKNFRVLRDAELRLGPFNILVGPNGSGKSTVFKALELGKAPTHSESKSLQTVGLSAVNVEVHTRIKLENEGFTCVDSWSSKGYRRTNIAGTNLNATSLNRYQVAISSIFDSTQIFALDPTKIVENVTLQPTTILNKNGSNLAGALDDLRDRSEESFDALKKELRQWLPEFDSIIFETPQPGKRNFKLRQAFSKEGIRSIDLSEGTLIAIALLYIAYHPGSPSIICLEEPDRGLHPRLLRDLRDALYRLSYPDQFGISRKPVQVIVTTHSPYFLDLFKDHPEEIIIAEKQPDATAKFRRLADDPELIEIIGDAPLGEVWYSGILGGVPIRP